MDNVKREQVVLPDGRRAERHISVDDQGKEVVEIFAEEPRALNLEKRIVREKKEIVARETTETIRDGEVVEVEVKDLEPQVPLQVRERIGMADHAKYVSGEYARKEEVADMVERGVLAAMSALLDKTEDPYNNEEEEEYEAPPRQEPVQRPKRHEPLFTAQADVEERVAKKEQNKKWIDIGLGVAVVAQIVFAVWYVMTVI